MIDTCNSLYPIFSNFTIISVLTILMMLSDQCITVCQPTARYPSCCSFFILHFLILHHYHVALFCVVIFSYCHFFVLNSFHVLLYFMLQFYTLQCFCFPFFSRCAFHMLQLYVLYFVHVALFPGM